MKNYSQKITQELEVIRKTLNFKDGAHIEEIKDASGLDIELRTLQRRMADLKNQGIVKSYGEKRATRYFLAIPPGFVAYEPEETYSSLQLSDASRELLAMVSRPILQRKPVGYNPDFLASYRPNIDHYLTPYELNRLSLQVELQFELILEKVQQIENPIEQAFFILVHFPYLQPFEDVNKRVSRLAANIPLNQHNLSLLSFIDVPHDMYIKGILAVYELNRVDLLKDIFLWAYERSALQYAAVRQTLRTPNTFNVKYREGIRAVVTAVVSNRLQGRSKNLHS